MPGSVLTVSSRALLDSCDRLGIDTKAILEGVGLDRSVIDDPDARLPVSQMAELWRRAYQASGDPDLALHAAESLRFGAYRVIDYLAGCSPTVGAALTQVSAYFPIINSTVRLPIEQRDGEHVLGIVCPEEPAALTRPYVEYTFAAVYLRVSSVCAARFAPLRVELAYPAPPSIAEHERLFGCPVHTEAEANALVFGRDAWEIPIPGADSDLFGVLSDHARILEARIPSEPETVREVRQAIVEQLQGGAPSLERTARHLAMSSRTLQRRLKERGLSFADLVDSTRADVAKAYLTDRRISVAEVAFLLGFAEQSSFNRAFKRWTGSAPLEYRRRA